MVDRNAVWPKMSGAQVKCDDPSCKLDHNILLTSSSELMLVDGSGFALAIMPNGMIGEVHFSRFELTGKVYTDVADFIFKLLKEFSPNKDREGADERFSMVANVAELKAMMTAQLGSLQFSVGEKK